MDDYDTPRKAIAMSLEKDTGLIFAKSGNKAESTLTLTFSAGTKHGKLAQNEEEEALKMAIAMSLEEDIGLSGYRFKFCQKVEIKLLPEEE